MSDDGVLGSFHGDDAFPVTWDAGERERLCDRSRHGARCEQIRELRKVERFRGDERIAKRHGLVPR